MFWELITIFGLPQIWTCISFVSFFLTLLSPKRTREYFILFTLLTLPSVTISHTIAHGLKLMFKIPRPCAGLVGCPTTYSFPSGHASVIFAAMTALGLYYKKKKVLIPALIFAGLVGTSRIVLGVHRIEDVLAGSAIGSMISILIRRAYETTSQV